MVQAQVALCLICRLPAPLVKDCLVCSAKHSNLLFDIGAILRLLVQHELLICLGELVVPIVIPFNKHFLDDFLRYQDGRCLDAVNFVGSSVEVD